MAGNETDTDLGLFLEQRLVAATDLPVFIHILSDTYDHHNPADERYSNLRWKREQLYRKRMILVFQKRDHHAVLVIGMSVHEYCRTADGASTSALTRSYIQYIDTTGWFKPRHMQTKVTRSLVGSYLEYCERVLKVHSVHLLASAKPSFLFAGSEFNELKGRLSSAKLVKWWLSVVEDFAADPQSDIVISVWSPGEDHIEDPRTQERICRRQARNKNSRVTWRYGPLADNPSAKLVDTVPLFEDDPKLKHFMTFYEDCGFNNLKMEGVAAKTFLETIGLRPEFRTQCHSTFIVVCFPGNQDSGSCVSLQGKPTQLAAFATKMLSNLTFEEEGKAVDSSGKIASWLKFMGSKAISIKLIPADKGRAGEGRAKGEEEEEEGIVDENEPINVQGLIKKQRKEQ